MEYFAAVPKDRLIGELNARRDAYYNWILVTGRLARWRIAYNTYYGQRGQHNSSFVTAGGDKGELSFLMSNEYRNLVRHLLVMTMQSRPSLETVSINTDAQSKASSYVAKGLIEYYRRDGKIDDNTYAAAEIALINDTGWVFNEWDKSLGQNAGADPSTGTIVRQGDIKSRARTPLDVVIDFTKLDHHNHDWRMVRDAVNKFDLAAQYPEKADKITSITRDSVSDSIFRFGELALFYTGDTSPDIDMWTFYHRKSPSMPRGRMVQMVDDIILYDGPIPYRRLPGNRICPSEMILSAMGYSDTNDLLGLQDVMDALISSGVTNMTTCGVNNVWTKPSPNFDFEQLAQGFNLIESDERPEVLQMNKLTPEWFSLVNFIVGRMEAISGVNSVARGNTQQQDLSGAAMALLQSMSIQFNTGLVKSVNKMVEDNGNDIIMLTQDFANEPKMGMIIGEKNKYMMKEYSGKDLAGIQRVYCRQSNPMKDTTSGRLTIIQEAAKTQGGLTKPEFAEILDTGNTDCLLEAGRNAKLSIDQENEALIRGEVPPVLFNDFHPNHIGIDGHGSILLSPESRKDPELLARVKQHMEDHLRVWQATDLNILRAYGIPPYIPPAPPANLPGVAGQPTGAGLPPQGRAPVPPGGPAAAVNSPLGGAPEVNQPGLPKNPLSGKQWNPETGGLPQGA